MKTWNPVRLVESMTQYSGRGSSGRALFSAEPALQDSGPPHGAAWMLRVCGQDWHIRNQGQGEGRVGKGSTGREGKRRLRCSRAGLWVGNGPLRIGKHVFL